MHKTKKLPLYIEKPPIELDPIKMENCTEECCLCGFIFNDDAIKVDKIDGRKIIKKKTITNPAKPTETITIEIPRKIWKKEQRYRQQGNFCSTCNGKLELVIKSSSQCCRSSAQPKKAEIKAIREKYKDDEERQKEEIDKLKVYCSKCKDENGNKKECKRITREQIHNEIHERSMELAKKQIRKEFPFTQ